MRKKGGHMAKVRMQSKGDGLYVRGKTWYLDFRHEHTRHFLKLGRGIAHSVAANIATVKRGEIIKTGAGIIRKKPKDLPFQSAREHFLKWAQANTRPHTVKTFTQCLQRLSASFSGKRLSQISSFDVERHKLRAY